MKPNLIFIIAIFIYSSAASADDPNNAIANLADDYAQCDAYYNLFNAAAKSENRTPPSFGAATTANNMLLFLEKGNTKKALSRYELSIKNAKEVINAEGWSRLILKYGEFCKGLLENPDERIKYWEGHSPAESKKSIRNLTDDQLIEAMRQACRAQPREPACHDPAMVRLLNRKSM
jgi:tetratricopeptide (TPR) repeat protein